MKLRVENRKVKYVVWGIIWTNCGLRSSDLMSSGIRTTDKAGIDALLEAFVSPRNDF
jgi:hypothetical protein